MQERFVQICMLLILLAPLASLVWQLSRVWRGLSSGYKSIVLYMTYSVLPVLIYIGGFFVLVGFEELAKISIIGEAYARSLLIAGIVGIALTLLGTIVFAVVTRFILRKSSRPTNDEN